MTYYEPSTIALPNRSAEGLPPAWQSLCELPAHWLLELPEPVVLQLEVKGAPAAVWFATRRPASAAAPVAALPQRIIFEADELAPLWRAVEADRVWHPEFLGFCFEKWRDPCFRLTQAEALAGANPDAREQWSLHRVLCRLQARVTALDLDADGQHTWIPLRTAA